MPTNAGNKAFEEGESKKRLSIKRMDCKYRVKGEAIAKFASLPAKKSAKAYAVIALQAAKKAGAVTGKGLKTAGAAASRACKPIGKKLYPVADYVVLRNARKVRDEFKEVHEGFGVAMSSLKEATGRGKLAVVKTFGVLAKKAFRRHRKIFTTAVNYTLPVLCAFLIVPMITAWSSATYALSVTYDGQVLGYVSDESVFNEAIGQAQARIINVEEGFALNQFPNYTLAKVETDEEFMDADTLTEKILEASSDVVGSASGLFVDGSFVGAVENRGEVETFLASVLDSYSTGTEGERVEFMRDIQFVDGLYPKDTVVTEEEIQNKLNSNVSDEQLYTVQTGDTPDGIAAQYGISVEQLRLLNPNLDNLMYTGNQVRVAAQERWLGVKLVRSEEEIRSIAYEEETTENSRQYKGYEKVVTPGENGEEKITYEVVYVNGVETGRTVTGTELLKAPVNEVTEIGTKEKQVTVNRGSTAPVQVIQGNGISTGSFMWPVAAGRLSSGFGYRWGSLHDGLDLAAPANSQIVASDGGTVVQAGWKAGGYGYCVFIDHGNGVMTKYYHMNSVAVAVGQQVSQGQLIGYVGNTGYSFGNHCHFTITINGTPVNPAPYLGI